MELFGGLALLSSIISLVLAVLNIILFFKIWGMTNDMQQVKKITDSLTDNVKLLSKHFCEEEYVRLHDGILKAKGITYVKNGNTITFSDGVVGTIHPHDNISYFQTDRKDLLFYKNSNFTANALYEYLTTKEECKIGFVEKRVGGTPIL